MRFIEWMGGTAMTEQPNWQPRARPFKSSFPLPEAEFHEIYSKVPRLTVELVVVQDSEGVLLVKRASGPCAGLWHIPGDTVRFGEPLVDAVRRFSSQELGLELQPGPLLGYIEYPSHYLNGLDSPVGIAFLCCDEGEQVPRGGC